MITHLSDLTPPNVRLSCNSPRDSAERLHLGPFEVLSPRFFQVDYNSESTFHPLGSREFKQGTGRQYFGKEGENLDFDAKFLTKREKIIMR